MRILFQLAHMPKSAIKTIVCYEILHILCFAQPGYMSLGRSITFVLMLTIATMIMFCHAS
jgi:hypothetical protein